MNRIGVERRGSVRQTLSCFLMVRHSATRATLSERPLFTSAVASSYRLRHLCLNQ